MKLLLAFLLMFPWSLAFAGLAILVGRRRRVSTGAWAKFRGLEELPAPRPSPLSIPTVELVLHLRRGAA